METSQSSQAGKWLLILGLLVLSAISVFGIFNTFTFNVISMVSALPTLQAQTSVTAALTLFTGSILYTNMVNIKRKDFWNQLKTYGTLVIVILTIAGLMILSKAVTEILIGMLIIGTSLYLFKLMFTTIKPSGAFGVMCLFIAIPVLTFTSGVAISAPAITIAMQVVLTGVLFIGVTWSRLQALLFRVRTGSVTNIEDARDDDQH